MAKEEKVEVEGEVVEALPNTLFRVKLDNDHMVLGHVAGKMRRFRIRILPGDRVRVELSPYDLDRARIVYRHRQLVGGRRPAASCRCSPPSSGCCSPAPTASSAGSATTPPSSAHGRSRP